MPAPESQATTAAPPPPQPPNDPDVPPPPQVAPAPNAAPAAAAATPEQFNQPVAGGQAPQQPIGDPAQTQNAQADTLARLRAAREQVDGQAPQQPQQ